MAERNFRQLLEGRWELGNFLCVGLDSELSQIPESARKGTVRDTILSFNKQIIDATQTLVCAFKPNPAFYESQGEDGRLALKDTISYIQEVAPEVPVILDAKRGDIKNTNRNYAESDFDLLKADAITVQSYLGGEPLEPFLERKEKGVIVLCHTSNSGAGEIQNLKMESGEPLYKVVARLATEKWNANGNCCVMVGATYPEELSAVRAIVGDMPILTAGIGAQHGDLERAVTASKDSRSRGFIINSSRSVIFASNGEDFADAARKKAKELHGEIQIAL